MRSPAGIAADSEPCAVGCCSRLSPAQHSAALGGHSLHVGSPPFLHRRAAQRTRRDVERGAGVEAHVPHGIHVLRHHLLQAAAGAAASRWELGAAGGRPTQRLPRLHCWHAGRGCEPGRWRRCRSPRGRGPCPARFCGWREGVCSAVGVEWGRCRFPGPRSANLRPPWPRPAHRTSAATRAPEVCAIEGAPHGCSRLRRQLLNPLVKS